MSKNENWKTINGVHVLLDKYGTIEKGPKGLVGRSVEDLVNKKDSDVKIRKGKDYARLSSRPGFKQLYTDDEADFKITESQKEYEKLIRRPEDRRERGAFFDEEGNILVHATGTNEELNFVTDEESGLEYNKLVEQPVWNGEKIVNMTHNHNRNTIFSPEDIRSFENLGSKNTRATLRTGVNYSLTNKRPKDADVTRIDISNGTMKVKEPMKKIGPDYLGEYSKVFDPLYDEIAKDRKSMSKREFDDKISRMVEKVVTPHMENWLNKNAKKYGYNFEKTYTNILR